MSDNPPPYTMPVAWLIASRFAWHEGSRLVDTSVSESVLNTLIDPVTVRAYPSRSFSLIAMEWGNAPIAVSSRLSGCVGADSETTSTISVGQTANTYNLLTEALNISPEGSNDTAMVSVSGDGPAAEIVGGTVGSADAGADVEELGG